MALRRLGGHPRVAPASGRCGARRMLAVPPVTASAANASGASMYAPAAAASPAEVAAALSGAVPAVPAAAESADLPFYSQYPLDRKSE